MPLTKLYTIDPGLGCIYLVFSGGGSIPFPREGTPLCGLYRYILFPRTCTFGGTKKEKKKQMACLVVDLRLTRDLRLTWALGWLV